MYKRRAAAEQTQTGNGTGHSQWVGSLGGRGTARSVDLSRTPVSDAQTGFLIGLKSLESLDLDSTETGDAAIVSVAGIKTLRRLSLRHTTVSDKGLRALPHCLLRSSFRSHTGGRSGLAELGTAGAVALRM